MARERAVLEASHSIHPGPSPLRWSRILPLRHWIHLWNDSWVWNGRNRLKKRADMRRYFLCSSTGHTIFWDFEGGKFKNKGLYESRTKPVCVGSERALHHTHCNLPEVYSANVSNYPRNRGQCFSTPRPRTLEQGFGLRGSRTLEKPGKWVRTHDVHANTHKKTRYSKMTQTRNKNKNY